MTSTASCDVSWDITCDFPAAAADGVGFEPVRTRCYRCGQRACKSCSTVRRDPHAGRRVRICRNCDEDER